MLETSAAGEWQWKTEAGAVQTVISPSQDIRESFSGLAFGAGHWTQSILKIGSSPGASAVEIQGKELEPRARLVSLEVGRDLGSVGHGPKSHRIRHAQTHFAQNHFGAKPPGRRRKVTISVPSLNRPPRSHLQPHTKSIEVQKEE